MLKQPISSKIVALIFGILVICFVIGFYIFAWTEPTSSPPEGNVAVPLNTSLSPQTKAGDLTIVNLNAATFRETGTNYFIDPGGALNQPSIKVKNYIQTEGYIQAEGGYKSSAGFYDLVYPNYFIDPYVTVGPSVNVKGYIQAEGGYKSSAGNPGVTTAFPIGSCFMAFENGLLIMTTCE